MTDSPKIFISYAWESPEHQDRVLAFADWFEMNGVEVIFDQYDPNPNLPWPKWMENALQQATFVISICTKTYCDRVMEQQPAGEGLGAQWEGTLIYNALSQQPSSRNKFQVVQFDSEDRNAIPSGLMGNNRYVIKQFELDDPRLEDLYRLITDQPRAKRPKRGDIIKLPSVERTSVPRSGLPNYEPYVAELRKVEEAVLRPQTNPLRKHADVRKGVGEGTYLERLARANAARAKQADVDEDIEATLFYAEKALRLDPSNVLALSLASDALYTFERYKECLPVLESYLAKRPGDALKAFRLLRVKDIVNGTTKAIELAKSKLNETPDEEEAVRGYASMCSDLGRHDLAIEAFESALERDGKLNLRSLLAVYYWFAGENTKATQILEELPRESMNAVDWTNLGVGRAEMGRFGMAIEAINEGLRLGGGTKFGQYALAEIYAMMGEPEAAVAKLEVLRDGGPQYLSRVRTERTFDPIRSTPLFQEFVRSLEKNG